MGLTFIFYFLGVDIVSKDYSYNWDYTQSAFFSLTILTTIGRDRVQLTN